MISIWSILLIWAWVSSGILADGYVFQYFQKEFPEIAKKEEGIDKRFAYFTIICGTGALVGVFMIHGNKHGLYPLQWRDFKVWNKTNLIDMEE